MVDRVIRIVLDSSGVRQGTQEIEGQLRGVETNTRRTTQTLGGLARAARAVVGFLGVREVIRYGDAWVNTGNRIRLATDSQEEFNAVQRELVNLSNETRSSLESTVELYARSERATRALGVSQSEVIDLTRTVNQTLQISGASAAEAAGSTVQFAQGLGSGALRGQELNSVLEQNARLANILADSFGVGVGELRALGEAGELTSERILLALQDSAAEVQGEFDQLNVSVGASFTVLNNSLLEFFGRLGDATGGTNRLSSAILRVAEFIRGPLLQGANDFIESFSAAADLIGQGFAGADDLVETLGFNSAEVFGFIGQALAELPLNVVLAIQIATTELVGFFQRTETRVRLVANTIAGTFNEILGRDDAVEANIASRLNLEGELTAELAQIEDERNRIAEESLRAQEELRERFANRRQQTSEFDLTVPGTPRGGDAGAGALTDEQQEFIDALQQTAVELAIETSLLEEAEGTILRYRTAIEAAALGEADFVEQALQVVDTINAQTEALEAAQNRAADNELIASLQSELELLELSNRERFIEVQLRELSAEATQEQIDKTRELAGELFDQQEALANQAETLQTLADQAARNIQDSFADFLFDPFDEGLEGLVSGFSDALRRIAAELLAQQIITAFLNAIGQTSGGGAIAAIFGGQRQAGGGVRADQSFLVGERGPELFTPPTAGNITPTNQVMQMAPQVQVGGPTIINAFDDRAIVGAFNRGGGTQAVLNIIADNPTAVRQAAGVN